MERPNQLTAEMLPTLTGPTKVIYHTRTESLPRTIVRYDDKKVYFDHPSDKFTYRTDCGIDPYQGDYGPVFNETNWIQIQGKENVCQ